MAKLLLIFGGTGEKATDLRARYEKNPYQEDVIRVYFNGCDDPHIGGSYLFGKLSPNLDVVGQGVRDCFDSQKKFSLTQLRARFKKSMVICPPETTDTQAIEQINMMGFSRGSVTTFSVARHLDDLGLDMHLFAQDPVPGESFKHAGSRQSEFSKNHDLTRCKNIKSAQVVIGGYRKDINYFHEHYFRQMAPVFNQSCDSHIYAVPVKYHSSFTPFSFNQGNVFLQQTGCTEKTTTDSHPSYYDEEKGGRFFTPRVIAQRHHQQHAMHFELLPRYKKKLCDQLKFGSREYRSVDKLQDKTIQALFALEQCDGDMVTKAQLRKRIRNENSSNDDTLRDFVVEFENINQHALRKSDIQIKKSDAMTEFRDAVYTVLTQYLDARTSITDATFQTYVNYRIQQLESHLPKKEYTCIKELTELFLSTNPLPSKDNAINHAHHTIKIKEQLHSIQNSHEEVKDERLDGENPLSSQLP